MDSSRRQGGIQQLLTAEQEAHDTVNAARTEMDDTNATHQGDAALDTTKKRKLTSTVWAEFDKVIDKDGKHYATCHHCKKKFVGESTKGTSHLKNHLKRCFYRITSSSGQQQLQFDKTQGEVSQPKVWKFDQEKCRRSFAIAIAKHNYPFSMSEHHYFKEFLSSVQPMFKMVSRNTLRSDVLLVYKEEKETLYKFLDKQKCKFSITTDLWTSEHQSIAYICVTCHFIDNDWILQKKIIAFRRFDFPHDAESLYSCMMELILEWNLDKKLFAIVVDNASNNDAMVRYLKDFLCEKMLLPLNGELFHVRCSAHILNLVVQDGLKCIAGLIENIRASVRYLHRSVFAKQKFDTVINQLKLNSKKKLPLDVPHRWNSTYLMLEAALPLKDAFERLTLVDKNFKTYPTEQEWSDATDLFDFLKSFYNATIHFSGSTYPTSNVYFSDMCRILLHIKSYATHDRMHTQLMIAPMWGKFQKYWNDCNLVLAIAVVFDPRYKMPLVHYYYEKIYGRVEAQNHIQQVRQTLIEIYQEYANAEPNYFDASSSSNLDRRVECDTVDENQGELDNFKLWYEVRNMNNYLRLPKKSELDIYLEEELIEGKQQFNILEWWKVYSLKLPILGKIARDVLAIPVTTVASESAFSTGGRIIDEERSCLDPEIVEALLCVNDWV